MLKSGLSLLVLENGHLQGGGGHGSCVCMPIVFGEGNKR